MYIDDLVRLLEEVREEHGNIEVIVRQKYTEYTGNSTSDVHVEEDILLNREVAVIEIE